MDLTQGDRDLLVFERGAWRLGPDKDRQIRLHLGLTPARYHQALDRLIDRPDALAFDPMTVRRLRRLREARRARRVARSAHTQERARWG